MHPITVRVMKFDIPSAADFHPLCIARSSILSYTHLGMSFYVALLEPFFVKSLHQVLDKIHDDALREEVDRFARQEARHYQRHNEFNDIILAHGYPGLAQRIEILKQDFERFLENATDRFRLGYIEGFESYTTQSALQLLNSGLYDHPRTSRAFGDLFKWHMLEEVEHRNVAYDVYQHIFGDYLYRARMCVYAQNHLVRFVADVTKLMSKTDVARYGEQCRVTAKHRRLMALNRIRMRLRTMLPWYTPHKYVLPDNIKALSEHFTQMAESIR